MDILDEIFKSDVFLTFEGMRIIVFKILHSPGSKSYKMAMIWTVLIAQ